jgi:ubiquinone/menaquinone biosynthesis C-methylase UbiE
VSRVTNYDRIASKYDRRYELYEYAGINETLANFLGDAAKSVLEVGCGTGHWLARVARSFSQKSTSLSGERAVVAGIEPSSEMLARARVTAPGARLIRGTAEALPFSDATFDRVCCINALHHFRDRVRFFEEARRILKPGGGLLSIGKDPHVERDAWWVYEFFPEALVIDRQRFARVRTLRGELAAAGFTWAESFECDHIEASRPARDALTSGIVDRAYTSQLTVLSDDEFDAGVARIRNADAAAGGELRLATDFYLYATIGWV